MKTLEWVGCPTCKPETKPERMFVGMNEGHPVWLHVSYADNIYGAGWDACLYRNGDSIVVIKFFLPTAWDAKDATHEWAVENGYLSSHDRMELNRQHATEEP